MNPETRYRLIVLDVDGTLVGDDRTVSQRLIAAVNAACDAGAIVSLATGRMLRSAAKYAGLVGANGPIICYQGALTVAADTRKVLREVRLERAEVMDTLTVLRSADVHINVYVDDEIFVESLGDWVVGYAQRMEIVPRQVQSLDELADTGPLAILGVSEPDASAIVERVRNTLGERARVTHSLRHFCEVSGSPGGKRAALESLAEYLGVDTAETIAFGDGQGDEGMLEWAALGVAVGDAHPLVVSAADVAIGGPDVDGPARFIESLLEHGRIGCDSDCVGR